MEKGISTPLRFRFVQALPVNRGPTTTNITPCIPRYFNDISKVFQLRFDCISRIAHRIPHFT